MKAVTVRSNNRLIIGDNLEVLRRARSGFVDLIYLDPPFNSKANYNLSFPGSEAQEQQFKDTWNWNSDIHSEYEEIRKSGCPVYHYLRLLKNTDKGSYLTFMASRLIELHRVLRETGSIYLHCDSTMSHYLKQVMDLVFGIENFRNEIVWCYTGASNSKRDFLKKSDTILRYSKSKSWIFNADDVRVPYTEKSLTRSKYDGGFGGDKIKLHPKGKIPENHWSDINPLRGNENVGYPTQKPLKLLERIILASSNKGDLVLDPFCGSGTTLVAADRLKRNWVGIDCSHVARIMLDARLDISDYILKGIPLDLASARQLASEDRTEFKRWAISELRRKLTGLSRIKTYDTDGMYYHLYFNTAKKDETGTVLVSVVSKIRDSHVKSMRSDIQDENALGGILLSLNKIDSSMKILATKAGTYKTSNALFPVIQLASIQDILDGRLPRIPSVQIDRIFDESVKLFNNVIRIDRYKKSSQTLLGASL